MAIESVIVILVLIFVFLIGFSAGKASVARIAARELRELQAEFERLSREARDHQVRVETLIATRTYSQ